MKAPTMTATAAKSFGGFSTANAAAVMAALGCGCKPYMDVFTYNRWRAQGRQVAKGEKAIRLPLVTMVVRQAKGEEPETRRMLTSSAVFCRHQLTERS